MGRIYGNLEALGIRQEPSPDPLDSLTPSGGKKPEGLLIYVHYPFCRSKCRYCAFHSQKWNGVTASWYRMVLMEEIRLWGERLKRPRVATVYVGGGTPSLMPLTEFQQLFDALGQAFSIEPGAEVTVEANPDSALDPSWFRALLSLGVNRLSLGVQSFDDQELSMLGRPHTATGAESAFGAARVAGFGNISLDLIWGLPGQRLGQWMANLRKAARDLRPEHLSCYGLTLERNTPMAKACEVGELVLPPEEEQARMYVHGAEYLESEGYLQYEVSNFARMGFSSRHNSGYWAGLDYLGLGPSAVSTLGTRRFSNPRYMDEYDAAVRGGFAGNDFEALTPETRAREMVMLSLRTTRGLDLAAYAAATGRDLLAERKSMIHALHRNHLIKISRGRLRLTTNGLLVSNSIIERLLDG